MEPLGHDERVAVARLRALLELLPTALDRQLSGTGVTSFEYTLLEALHAADLGRLRLTALASRTNATLPRLSRVVTGLERKGLVTRAACEEDGRATNAVLTPAGAEAYLQARPIYEGAVKEMILGNLDGESVGQLSTISYAVLTGLDPERRLAVTLEGAPEECAADPIPHR
ncbi:MarR family transcriptional regulator [Microbacterium sp. 2FI]|uniref:MarR family winged helix-turn-helix transcriptional regulator n=1 Tax=Microbacterium sp. 2FI TaxID=2502193 RepID=UPI0010F6E543|nr:MarR family transcriptional regulator [Microbacterium sp. 2FI]